MSTEFRKIDGEQEADTFRAQKAKELAQQALSYELTARQMALLAADEARYNAAATAARTTADDHATRAGSLAAQASGDGQLTPDEKENFLEAMVDGYERGIAQNEELLANADLYWSKDERKAQVRQTERNVVELKAALAAAEELLSEATGS